MTATIQAPQTFMGYKANNDSNLTNIRDLLVEHSMNYNVVKVPALIEWEGETREAGNQFHLVQENNGEVLSGATVTKTYRPMTPGDIADDFQFFVDQGYAHPFSAFRTRNGVECIALLLDPNLFPGSSDTYHGFILGQNRQGNKGATGSLFVQRKICSNGMMGWAKESHFSVAHRGEIGRAPSR